ncbi:hypothetical protein EIP91_012004 [Steccherinum ochraceum]|uniref:DUF3533 domain-containing protein n=1 Tax=Steccherinum ochraceum TaxID=92696 RepID=A0A4R0RV71_9APHY|nr:hypothetical protein EIP91_012004 [Steccherinum ochraceum]
MAAHTAQSPAGAQLMPGSGRLSADAGPPDAEYPAIVAEPRDSPSRHSFGHSDSDKDLAASKLALPEAEKAQDLPWEESEQRPRPVVYSFFAPQMAAARKTYLLFMCRVTVVVIVLMWASLPAFWGALSNSSELTSNLEAWFIDRDDSRIGHALWAGIQNSSGMALGWRVVDPDVAGSDADIIQAVVTDQAWVALVVSANATSNLALARENGDMSYDPRSAVTVYYAQARHEVATANFVTPILQNTLKPVMVGWAVGAAQRYFAQISPGDTVNATAVQMLSNAPQTIMPAIDYTMVNLRPYTAPAALAVTLVGNIFLIIFGFLTVMANNHARSLIAPNLSLGSYCLLRVFIPLAIYWPISLGFNLISLAFDLPFGGKYSYGTGFIVAWVYTYLGLAALGLSLESMITILTGQFTPFFLFVLIVYNVAPVLLPPELQSPFFQYGQGFPVPNLSLAMRTIFFNTAPNPGRYAGVLFGWIILSIFTMLLFTCLTHRRRTKRAAH